MMGQQKLPKLHARIVPRRRKVQTTSAAANVLKYQRDSCVSLSYAQRERERECVCVYVCERLQASGPPKATSLITALPVLSRDED